ncbi:N-Acetylneuraminate cytidylyltransferase [Helicobacter bizzozeronii CCUG 35545]|uniref:N-acetylneuraminate cytidylyltransferase n=1 Tax=Helicobacter bizzozeronii TaxID=56877 RepID=H2B3K1_HELBI|nr:N-acetylneuraminate cytidylyltransferase [Helicobacter bizzozeronii]CCF81650.1 N-Acetylneuraminate cytidylyltransferase [Helicobacter bizzozeronii CCUG 35545]
MTRVLAYIPARSGSQGVKHKNIRDFKGLPLMAHTILAAKESAIFSEVFVSTDSPEYATIAKRYGASVPFLRSKETSSHNAPTMSGLLEALQNYQNLGQSFDHVAVLQPTSPLRDATDIQEAYKLFCVENCDPLASVHVVSEHPLFMRTLHNHRLTPILNAPSSVRRQDLPAYYKINGAIYIHQVETLTPNTSLNDALIGYEIALDHALDIDCLKDFDA